MVHFSPFSLTLILVWQKKLLEHKVGCNRKFCRLKVGYILEPDSPSLPKNLKKCMYYAQNLNWLVKGLEIHQNAQKAEQIL